ncbi:hypothetical protein HMPREF1141_1889 [Clostridium sp. MSTE9]|nr:hypothetical protein HMPREF1141_1889 [Clostridium sp. MSTE9]
MGINKPLYFRSLFLFPSSSVSSNSFSTVLLGRIFTFQKPANNVLTTLFFAVKQCKKHPISLFIIYRENRRLFVRADTSRKVAVQLSFFLFSKRIFAQNMQRRDVIHSFSLKFV